MTLFVDGMRDATPIDDMPVEWIRAVEVYTQPGSIPPRFGGTNGDCGVIAVWMK